MSNAHPNLLPHPSPHSLAAALGHCEQVAISPDTSHASRRGQRSDGGRSGGRGTRVARGEEGLVVGGADVEGDLGFGADEGAAGVVGGRARGDGLAGAGGGVEGGGCVGVAGLLGGG